MPILGSSAFENTQSWIKCANPQRSIKSLRSTSTITTLLFEYGRIITADDEGIIQVFDNNGHLVLRLKGHKLGVWCLITTRTKLISGSEDKTIRVWNLLTGSCTHVFRGHTGVVRCLKIAHPETPLFLEDDVPKELEDRPQPIRPLIVSGSRDGSVRVWMLPRSTEAQYGRQVKGQPEPDPDPLENPYHLYHLTGHEGPVRCVAANRRVVLSGGQDCTVRAYDIKTDKLLSVLRGHTQKITNVIIDPHLRRWFSSSMDGTIRLWNSSDGSLWSVCTLHSGPVLHMFSTPWQIYTAAEDGLAMTWSTAKGEQLHVFDSGDGKYLMDLAGDEYKVLTVTEASAKFFHPQDARLVRTLYQCSPGEKLSHVAFEYQQCALTYKDSRGHNRLVLVDFRASENINKSNFPPTDAVDSDEANFHF